MIQAREPAGRYYTCPNGPGSAPTVTLCASVTCEASKCDAVGRWSGLGPFAGHSQSGDNVRFEDVSNATFVFSGADTVTMARCVMFPGPPEANTTISYLDSKYSSSFCLPATVVERIARSVNNTLAPSMLECQQSNVSHVMLSGHLSAFQYCSGNNTIAGLCRDADCSSECTVSLIPDLQLQLESSAPLPLLTPAAIADLIAAERDSLPCLRPDRATSYTRQCTGLR